MRSYQFSLLIAISLFLLWMAPGYWNFSPDGGIYIGGAMSIVESGEYHFNGSPILIYYPGFSMALAIPISLFGLDFSILHLYCAMIAIIALWLSRSLFTSESYGLVGLAVPILMVCAGVFQEQALFILSDGLFLTLSLVILLTWRRFTERGDYRLLWVCVVLVAYLPLVRLQGLFMYFALMASLFVHDFYKQSFKRERLIRFISIAVIAILPFSLWSLRNYYAYSPDLHNMANSFFFGQKGLSVYAPSFGKAEWIDAPWKYGIYNLLYTFRDLFETLVGRRTSVLFPLEAIVLLLVGLMGLGSLRWFRNASWLERSYVLISFAFIAVWALRSSSLYTVPRYWLPLLPFVLLLLGNGLATLINAAKSLHRARSILVVFAGLSAAFVVSSGISAGLSQVQPSTLRFNRNSNETLAKVSAYINENAPLDSPVAVTDWGVLPLMLERSNFQLTNDKNHAISLKRIVDNKAEYLAILDETSLFSKSARKLTQDLPNVFHPALVIDQKGFGASGAVYSIDLEKAENVLQNLSP